MHPSNRPRPLALAAVLVTPLVPGLAGCVAAGAAAGATAGAVGIARFDEGRVHRDLDVGFDEAWDAALATIPDLGYPLPAIRQHTPTEGELVSERLVVRLEAHPDGYTCVTARVGDFAVPEARERASRFVDELAVRLDVAWWVDHDREEWTEAEPVPASSAP